MRSTRKSLNDKHAKTVLNFHLLDDLIENVRGIYFHTDKYGVMDKEGLKCLNDARETYFEIDRREDTIHFDTTFWDE